jgi:hypothetical protein
MIITSGSISATNSNVNRPPNYSSPTTTNLSVSTWSLSKSPLWGESFIITRLQMIHEVWYMCSLRQDRRELIFFLDPDGESYSSFTSSHVFRNKSFQ